MRDYHAAPVELSEMDLEAVAGGKERHHHRREAAAPPVPATTPVPLAAPATTSAPSIGILSGLGATRTVARPIDRGRHHWRLPGWRVPAELN